MPCPVMDRACVVSGGLAEGEAAAYTKDMCKPIRDYLSVLRDYTREIITFGGFCLMCFVYNDFRQLAQDQARTSAHTVDVLRAMDARLAVIEQHSITPTLQHP